MEIPSYTFILNVISVNLDEERSTYFPLSPILFSLNGRLVFSVIIIALKDKINVHCTLQVMKL